MAWEVFCCCTVSYQQQFLCYLRKLGLVFLQVSLLPCYIISQCLKFASPASTLSEQSTQWGLLGLFSEGCVCVCVYTGASGQVPMVTERRLTVFPRLHLMCVCLCACLCLANYPSGLLSTLREVYIITLTAWWSLVR